MDQLQQIVMLPALHGAAAFLLVTLFAYRGKLVAGATSAAAAIAAKVNRTPTPVYDGTMHVVDMDRHDCLRKLRHDVSEMPPDERTKGLALLDQVDELVRQVERQPATINLASWLKPPRAKLADVFDPMGPQLDPDRGGAA